MGDTIGCLYTLVFFLRIKSKNQYKMREKRNIIYLWFPERKNELLVLHCGLLIVFCFLFYYYERVLFY